MKRYYVAFIVLLSGCSQHQMYDSIQVNQRNECERLSGIQRDECLKQLGPDYQTYERQRRELLEK